MYKPIVIYEFEACPFCRRVRELVTHLDLEVPKSTAPHLSQLRVLVTYLDLEVLLMRVVHLGRSTCHAVSSRGG